MIQTPEPRHCNCRVTDRGADGYPICMECFKRQSEKLQLPTWLQRMQGKDLTGQLR